MTTTQLERAFTDHRVAATETYREIAEAAATRALTDDERATLGALLETSHAMRREMALPSPGTQFVRAGAFEVFRRSAHRTVSESPTIDVLAAAPGERAVVTTSGLTLGQGEPIRPWPARRGAASLFPHLTTTANAIVYPREQNYGLTAAVTPEGTAKPVASIEVEAVTSPVFKVATYAPISEELFDDLPGLAGYIDTRLMSYVDTEYDNQIVNGPNGLIAQLAAATGGWQTYARGASDSNAAAILDAAAQMFLWMGLIADGVLISPGAYARSLLRLSGTGDVGAVDLDAAVWPPAMLWGMRVGLATGMGPSLDGSEAVVGAFDLGAALYDKPGVSISISNSHLDTFVKNTLTIRAERRVALALYMPAAFIRVTGLATGSVAGRRLEPKQP